MAKNNPLHYRIRNWDQFQQYKDRNPKWVKLHYEMLHSADWVNADDETRVLMVVCMLIGSRHGGQVPNDVAYIKRVGYLNFHPTFDKLLKLGFLIRPKYLRQKEIPVRNDTQESEKEGEIEKEKKDSGAQARSKPRTRIGDYRPSEFEQAKAQAYWHSKGRDDLTVADQVERFVAFHESRGTTMADWPRAWQTWYMNAIQYGKGRSDERKPTAHASLQAGTLLALERIKRGGTGAS